jgi:outer membrane protein assembly factor BamA
LRFLPLPSLTISPETGIKGGGFVDYFYRNKMGKDSVEVRPSSTWVQALYSTRGQLTIEGASSTYTHAEKFYIGFRGGFVSYYERFWGFSEPTLGNKDYIDITYHRIFASGRVTKNLGKRFFSGIGFYYSHYDKVDFTIQNSLQESRVPLDANSNIGGAGLVFTLDRRDNQFSPTKGFYIDASYMWYHNFKTQRLAYTGFTTDIRQYNEFGRHIWVQQFLMTHLDGDVPAFEKARLGGSNMMRGFFQGRYRDNNIYALQIEYRYRLSRFVKLACFASIGNTSADFQDLFTQNLLFSGGTGLRFLVNKNKKYTYVLIWHYPVLVALATISVLVMRFEAHIAELSIRYICKIALCYM